jgi:Domain of unknown function (DUF4833)
MRWFICGGKKKSKISKPTPSPVIESVVFKSAESSKADLFKDSSIPPIPVLTPPTETAVLPPVLPLAVTTSEVKVLPEPFLSPAIFSRRESFHSMIDHEDKTELSSTASPPIPRSVSFSFSSAKLLTPDQIDLLSQPTTLFIITKNVNSNTVLYFRDPDTDDVKVEWRKFEEKSVKKQKQPLKSFENKLAYGFTLQKETGKFKLAAMPKREMHVVGQDTFKRVEGLIDGNLCIIKRIHVTMKNSVFPQVDFLEIFGVDTQSGKELIAKVNP